MSTKELAATARALVAEGKGILAADESTGTMTRRLQSIGVESTEDSRRSWRELMFTADGFAEYISGVILFDETIRQSSNDGRPPPTSIVDACPPTNGADSYTMTPWPARVKSYAAESPAAPAPITPILICLASNYWPQDSGTHVSGLVGAGDDSTPVAPGGSGAPEPSVCSPT